MQSDERPIYEAPEVVTYSDEDILDQLGPAHARPLPRISPTPLP